MDIKNIFSNREIASIIFFVGIIVFGLLHKNVRQTIPSLIKSMFAYKLVIVFSLTVILFVISLFLISRYIRITTGDMKDSIVWFFTVGLGLVLGNLNGDKFHKKEIFNNIIIAPIKFSVFLQYLLSTYVFPIYIELILVPVISLIVMCEIFSKGKKQYKTANQFFNRILVIVGLYIIIYVISYAIKDYKHFASAQTLVNYFLPTILTLIFLPFAYLIVIYSKYELQFIRYDRIKNASLVKYLKLRTILYAKFSLSKIDTLCSVYYYNYYEIETKENINEYIHSLKANYENMKKEV